MGSTDIAIVLAQPSTPGISAATSGARDLGCAVHARLQHVNVGDFKDISVTVTNTET